jgi:hypothetical protein
MTKTRERPNHRRGGTRDKKRNKRIEGMTNLNKTSFLFRMTVIRDMKNRWDAVLPVVG